MYIPFYNERINHIKREKDEIERKPAQQSEKKDLEDLLFLDK